ncbi:MAG TPA: PEPxxWA-CTERM sorting domain-containing protein [Croceibacterium sp.]|nr:PEPxxWA-CTERM sorting domain-containing protein [Croceibacterium sp.]
MRYIAFGLAAGAVMMALPVSATSAVKIKSGSRFVQPIEAVQLGAGTARWDNFVPGTGSRNGDPLTTANSDTLAPVRGLTTLEALNASNAFLTSISPTVSISGQNYSGFLVDKFTPMSFSRIVQSKVTRIASKGQLGSPVTTSAALQPAPEQVGAVPEPATWAMLVVGFAAVGGAMRRKRHSGGVQRASAA